MSTYQRLKDENKVLKKNEKKLLGRIGKLADELTARNFKDDDKLADVVAELQDAKLYIQRLERQVIALRSAGVGQNQHIEALQEYINKGCKL